MSVTAEGRSPLRLAARTGGWGSSDGESEDQEGGEEIAGQGQEDCHETDEEGGGQEEGSTEEAAREEGGAEKGRQSQKAAGHCEAGEARAGEIDGQDHRPLPRGRLRPRAQLRGHRARSEEHTSELQSRQYLVCRLLL